MVKCPTPTLPLHEPSTSQASNYNPRWWHRKPDLSSVPLQNNAGAGHATVVFVCFGRVPINSFLLGQLCLGCVYGHPTIYI